MGWTSSDWLKCTTTRLSKASTSCLWWHLQWWHCTFRCYTATPESQWSGLGCWNWESSVNLTRSWLKTIVYWRSVLFCKPQTLVACGSWAKIAEPSAILCKVKSLTDETLGTIQGFWSPPVHPCASTDMQQAHQATMSCFTGLALVGLSQGANCVHDLIRPKEDCHVCPIVLHDEKTPQVKTIHSYCWWKNSCTWDSKNPLKNWG